MTEMEVAAQGIGVQVVPNVGAEIALLLGHTNDGEEFSASYVLGAEMFLEVFGSAVDAMRAGMS